MDLCFTQLRDAAVADIVALHNDADVRRHLPLAIGRFDAVTCRHWIDQKEAHWARHGYGPWAIVIGERFAGWGGLQNEDGDADLALVLSPPFWGHGPAICHEILRIAFDELGLASVTARLPESRTRTRGLRRYGFRPDGLVAIDDIRFARFRRIAPERSRRFGFSAEPR